MNTISVPMLRMDFMMCCIGELWYMPPKASATGPGTMVIMVWIASRITGNMVFSTGFPPSLCASGLMKRSAINSMMMTAISESSSFISRN